MLSASFSQRERTRQIFRSLYGDRLGQVPGEVDVQTLHDGQPVGNELERDDVEDTLETVNRLGYLNFQGLAGLEFVIVDVADDDGLATTSSNC